MKKRIFVCLSFLSSILLIGLLTVGGLFRSVAAAETDLSDLVKLAARYELPQPPKDAPLVLANTGWTSVIGHTSTSRDPGIYRPAFLLEKRPDGKALVLMGWEQRVVESDAKHRPATRPFSLQAQPAKLKGYLLASTNMSAFVSAIQLAARGDHAKAQQLYKQIAAAEFLDGGHPHEGLSRLKDKPRLLLARCLYQHFQQQTLSDKVELKQVFHKLTQLKQEFPRLFSDDPQDYYPHRRTRFVRDLGRAVNAAKPPAGSVESLLIAWGNGRGRFWKLGPVDDRDEVSDRPAREILRRGAKAIPPLARLRDDQRLTRRVSPAIMNAPERRLRLGELASRILDEMIASQNLESWRGGKNHDDAERLFFEKAAVAKKDGVIQQFHEVPLWILGEKYPKSLIALCAAVPAQTAPNTPLFELAEVVARSKLSAAEKTQALTGVSNRLTRVDRQRAVLQQLAKVDEALCVKLLKPLLTKLPSDVKGPYWTSEAANFTHVVMQLQRDEIWRDYLRVAKRSSVGLRMEMMNPMNYTYIGAKNKQRRLAFLAAFLDDAAIRDLSANSTRFSGPCAGFTFKKLAVRDYVAMKIASLLRFSEQPDEFWTAAQWTALRKRVRDELSKQELPDLTS